MDVVVGAVTAATARLAGDPGYGAESGLGGLHALVTTYGPRGALPHPNALEANYNARLGQIAVAEWGPGAPDQVWYDFSVFAAQNCHEIERGLTGRVINPWERSGITTDCVAAASVLGQEATNAPFSQNARRNWFTGISIGLGRDGPTVGFDLGALVDRLTSTTPERSLQSGNSIHAFRSAIKADLNACAMYVEEMEANECGGQL